MQWRSILLAATAGACLVLAGCGGGGSGGSGSGDSAASNASTGGSTQANALCPSSLDYSTVYTGGSGAGELVTVQLDTTAMTWKVTFLKSPIPAQTGTATPTRDTAPYNVVTGTLSRVTTLPTAKLNACAYTLNGASLDASQPARIFVGNGVAGGAIPGATLSYTSPVGTGSISPKTFPYYPFLGFSTLDTNLANVASTFNELGIHTVPTQSYTSVAVDAQYTISASGTYSECTTGSTCKTGTGAFTLDSASGTFWAADYIDEVSPTNPANAPQGTGILIVGKLRGQDVPVLVRVGAANPLTFVVDDESGIAVLGTQTTIASGSQDGEYIAVDANLQYRSVLLVGAQMSLLDPFDASNASLASTYDLDYTQSTPGVVGVTPVSGGSGETGKTIFNGGVIAYLDTASATAPYFTAGAFVESPSGSPNP
ncbi:DUF2957 domain-containing protein [Pararobbsia silviterrae]|uniref:DUF2957 domain-containing protein n=1 Tax=Pararobbsia silviterrae TaxID=1792498 RepID=A0A494WZX1_9BURK|nr:DUF2957 domain-containing protein [Pararobbsia silviterrae]RKP44075.1 DUF2957 domain-containing protein [Pararobbsia silviterrae]